MSPVFRNVQSFCPWLRAAGIEYAITGISGAIILEAVVKLLGMGPGWYWRSHWNKFDGLLALACLADLIMQARH